MPGDPTSGVTILGPPESRRPDQRISSSGPVLRTGRPALISFSGHRWERTGRRSLRFTGRPPSPVRAAAGPVRPPASRGRGVDVRPAPPPTARGPAADLSRLSVTEL